MTWKELLQLAGVSDCTPAFYQYVGNEMFKDIIRIRHPIQSSVATSSEISPMTYKDINALRYFAGYIPRMLRKRLRTSTHPLKDDILLCIHDLLDDGEETNDESQDWVHHVNRGGLTLVNNSTFDVFLAIEEVNKRIGEDWTDKVKAEIVESEDVEFLWSLVCGDWEEGSSKALLQMIVNQYVKIRGFSYSSKLMEEYKAANKKTTQKSKGIRKQLISSNDTSTS